MTRVRVTAPRNVKTGSAQAGAELPISRRHLPSVREKLEATRIRPQA